MTEPIEVLKFDQGVRAEIHYDDVPIDPREHDNLAKMVCWHRRSDLGDETVRAPDFDSIIAIADHYEFVIWQPLWLYEHSGMTIRTTTTNDNPFMGRLPQGHAEFDSGMVGLIGITKDTLAKEYEGELSIERATEVFEAEVAEYDQWLTGDVYGYVIKSSEGVGVRVHDACWGFFGIEYAKEEARHAAQNAVDSIAHEKSEMQHWAARDVETTS